MLRSLRYRCLPGGVSQAAVAAGAPGAAAAPASTVTINGPAVKAVVKKPGGTAKLTFHGEQGQRVTVVARHVTTSDGGCATLTVSDGATPACMNSGTSGSGGQATLSQTGTYTILFEVDPTATGQRQHQSLDVTGAGETAVWAVA